MSAVRSTSQELASEIGISDRTVRDVCQKYGVPGKKGEGYARDDALVAIAKYSWTRLDAFDAEAAKDRARKARAEADNVELDNAEKRGDIKRRGEQFATWLGSEWRKEIMAMTFLTVEVKKAILRKLADIKLPPFPSPGK